MMPSSPHQFGHAGGPGSGRRNRRSTSDISSAAKEGRKWSITTAFSNSKKSSNSDANNFPGSSPSFVDPVIANNIRQLQKCSSKIQNLAKNVDSAWDEYHKVRERCLDCCKSLMTPPVPRRESSVVSPTSSVPPKSEYHRDHSFDTLNLVTIDTSSSSQSSGSRVDPSLYLGSRSDECQKAAHGWQTSIEVLANTLRTSLQETYNAYDGDPTPEGFERLCNDKQVRFDAIRHMRNASISKMMSADLNFFPRYDVRFRNYDEIKKDLVKVQSILGTSGIPQNRTIIERRISPTGDVMLEFANADNDEQPVFRFRVASHCLRETSSPIFGYMFNPHFRAELDDDIRRSVPLPPSKCVCADGNEVMLYRMPQTELNTQRSLEILLHAAHNHHDRVPREVQFSQFVAIAEVCLRYRCTSPLEMAVEHLWLPCLRDNATDDMLADVLLISYVFGLSDNFTCLSRMAILAMTGPGSNWPQKVEEKIEAVRRAKIEQVYELCRMTLNEYLYPTPRINPASHTNGSQEAHPNGLRCPRGDRTCDTQNLGWYMKTLAELGILPAILPSPAPFPHNTQPSQTQQSLLEIFESLCLMTSPPQSHGGICDFAPAFQDALRDIYESVAGLTLYDVSGKRGWALSKNRSPRQSIQNQGNGAQGGVSDEQLFKIAAQQRYVPADRSSSVAPFQDRESGTTNDDWNEADGDSDACYARILSLLDDPRDLRAAALVNKSFYRCYLRDKTRLLERTQRALVDGIAEVEGSPCSAMVSDGATTGPSHEKFKNGQLLVIEGKSLVEGDANKYPRDIRERMIGLSIKGAGLGQSSWSKR